MNTADMIETIIDNGVRAYKHNSVGSVYAQKLNRHETVVLDGIEFNYWREFGVYKTAEYIKDIEPEIEIDVNLDGNNSYLTVNMIDDNQQQRLNQKLWQVIKNAHISV